MRIRIITIGKIKEKWLQDGIKMYKDRLSKYCQVDILELPDAPDSFPLNKALEMEAQSICARIDIEHEYYVLVDLHGKAFDSFSWAEEQLKWMELSQARLNFIIGGSRGFAETLRRAANVKVKLSDLTFTHQMTRLILLEQIYRGFKINQGETYHK